MAMKPTSLKLHRGASAALLILAPLLLARPAPARELTATPPEDAAVLLTPSLACSATELVGAHLRQEIRAEMPRPQARRKPRHRQQARRSRPAPPSAPMEEFVMEEPPRMFLRAFHICMGPAEPAAQPVRYRT